MELNRIREALQGAEGRWRRQVRATEKPPGRHEEPELAGSEPTDQRLDRL